MNQMLNIPPLLRRDPLNIDSVCEYIRKARGNKLLFILDAAVESTAEELGDCNGLETDRSRLLLQLESADEEEARRFNFELECGARP
jgi:hypothetical protein